jgi:hypothetical protein
LFDPTIGKFRKKSKYDIAGTSDIFALHFGRFIAIEVKAIGGKMTENQKEFRKNVIENGGYAITAFSVGEVKGAIDIIEEEIAYEQNERMGDSEEEFEEDIPEETQDPLRNPFYRMLGR